MFKNIVLFCLLLILASISHAQISDQRLIIEDYYESNPPGGEMELQLTIPAAPVTGTVNMGIILCVEKDQDRTVLVSDFINRLKHYIPNYFGFTTQNNFNINFVDVLTDGINPLNPDEAYAYELPGKLRYEQILDTAYVASPWMVRNILDKIDQENNYDFNNLDYNGDGIVDMLALIVLKHTAKNNGGIAYLSVNSYTTNDYSSGAGRNVEIERDNGIMIKYRNPNVDNHTSFIIHELGHAFFGFPDYDHDGFTTSSHYGLGDFCSMSCGGFSGIASPYNPVLRINKGWITPIEVTATQDITFTDLDVGGTAHVANQYGSDLNPFIITYHDNSSGSIWVQNWPLPQTTGNTKGILIWKNDKIISAHGKWLWESTNVPHPNHELMNTARAINLGIPDPILGKDSLEVRYSYVYYYPNPQNPGEYIEEGTYPDKRIGSESCFYDPGNSKVFSLSSNPTNLNISGNIVSTTGVKIEDFRIENNLSKASLKLYDGLANTLEQDFTFSNFNNTYWQIKQDLIVAPGVNLTIEPDAKPRFGQDAGLTVQGSLNGDNVTFSNRLNNQNWDGIYLANGSTSVLENCSVRNYPDSNPNTNITTVAGNLTVKGTLTFYRHSTLHLTLTGNINFTPGSNLVIKEALILDKALTIPQNATLTLEPGAVIICNYNNASIIVNGTLIAEGTSQNRITFNFANRYSSNLLLNSGSISSLSYCDFQNVGPNEYGAIYIASATASISNCEITNGVKGYFISGNSVFNSDLVLPSSVQYNFILEGSNIVFNNGSKLIVNGRLFSMNEMGQDIQIDFVLPDNIKQNGCYLNPGAALSLDNVRLKINNAWYGMSVNSASIPENCEFTNCYYDWNLNGNITYHDGLSLYTQSNHRLKVNPGAYLHIPNYNLIYSNGMVEAVGTPENMITFDFDSIGEGNGLIVTNANISYSRIKNAYSGIRVVGGGNVVITNNFIDSCYIGIYSYCTDFYNGQNRNSR